MKSYFLTRRAVRHAMPGMLIALVLTACSDPVQPMPSDGNSGADAVADQISAPDTIVPVDVAPTRCRTVNDCDDGISCTEDSCGMDGMCAHTANNMRCDDGRFCNGSETCDVGRGCTAGTVATCDDMNANTTDRCDDAANACRHDPLDADGDGDPAISAGGRDCDDNDATRSSLAREVCNMRDDNCNGMIDEGALNSCGSCDPACRGVAVGGMGGRPFTPGGQRGVEVDPMAGGLVVRAQSRTGDYLWIPNVNESTLSKWDASVNPPVELGRYRIGLPTGECVNQCCHANGCNMPSRTVVDGFGDAYVANRGFGMQGTVSKIAADRRDCVDRNGNGMIDTSTGPTDVRPYGQDECLLWTSNVGHVNATLRAIATDRGDAANPQGYVWVGNCGGAPTRAWKLNPVTGAVTNTLDAPPGVTCLYGAVGTADGRVWFHQSGANLVPVNGMTNTFETPVPIRSPSGCNSTYGITADALGRLWMSTPSCNFVPGYDPATRQWTSIPIGAPSGLGITSDSTGNLWTHRWTNGSQLYRFAASAFVAGGTAPAAAVTTINTGRAFGATGPIGADRSGQIWFVSYDLPSTLVRYVPGTGVFTNFSGPNRPYTYTDFTGSVRRTVIGTGVYTEDYDTMCDNPTIAQLEWDSVTPAGTTLNFALQTAATPAGLGGSTSVPLAVAPTNTSPRDVSAIMRTAMVTARRHVRVTVTFNPTTMPIASPVLRSLNLSWRCGYTVPAGG